jgi:DNA polymerase-4
MKNQKKIIHVDMDYFFAQVEIRDNPSLKNKPVAIGSPSGRGVLSTCNYIARSYGLRSAMPSFKAKELCPEVVFVRGDFKKYREASAIIFDIFSDYTELVEGISIDEAYLDVTSSEKCFNSATLMAQEIRKKIYKETGLTASAGVSYNKLLSKIASVYNKPNGLFVLAPGQAESFLKEVSISQMWGVGKVTQKKMLEQNIKTFGDLQKFSKLDLINFLGNHGAALYDYARGIDDREVETSSERKSLSVENTFRENLATVEQVKLKLFDAYSEMSERLSKYSDRFIKSHFVKIKYNDFSKTTVEAQYNGSMSFESFFELCLKRLNGEFRPIRLLGTGVRFFSEKKKGQLLLPLDI